MTYRCDGCGAEFDEPALYREERGEHFGFPAYESYCGCPYCGDSYEEIREEEVEEEIDEEEQRRKER